MNVFDLFAKLSLDKSDYEQGLETAKKAANRAGLAIGAAFTAATTAATIFGKTSVKVGMQFDAAMSQVAATMGVTTDEIENLREFAQKMGATTEFLATQSAVALNYMALAGYDAETSIKMLPNVLNLASAGGMDLARASDMLTDSQSALGLSLDETGELVDKMAKAAASSNTSVSQLGDAILTVGGTAKILKGNTTELSTALGILADNGVKGSEGGTALRNIILALTAPTNKAQKTIESLSVSVFDAEGNMRGLNEIFEELNASLSHMTQQERQSALSEIFNNRDLKSAEALLANVNGRWDELAATINQAQGSAEKMAQTQLGNLTGDIKLLKSAAEGAQLAFSEGINPALREIVQSITVKLSQASVRDYLKQVGKDVGELAQKLAHMAANALPRILSLFEDGGKKATMFAVGIGAVVVAIKAAVDPIGALMSGVTMLAGGLALAALTADSTTSEYLGLNKAQIETLKSAQLMVQEYEELRTARKDQLWKIDEEADKTRYLWKELQKLADENGIVADGEEERAKSILNDLNTQLGTEYEMNDKVIKQYKDMGAEIENLINKKRAAKYIESGEEVYSQSKKQLSDLEAAIADQENVVSKYEPTIKGIQERYAQYFRNGVFAPTFEEKWADESLIQVQKQWDNAYESYSNAQKRLSELTASEKDAYFEIERYEKAYAAFQEGRSSDVIELYERETAARINSWLKSKSITSEQMKEIEDELNRVTSAYNRYQQNYERGIQGYTETGFADIKERYEAAQSDYARAQHIYRYTEGREPGSIYETPRWDQTLPRTIVIELNGKELGRTVFDLYNTQETLNGEVVVVP